MKLSEIEIGQSAVVREAGGNGSLRQHFLDMGIIPGTTVKLVKYAPLGDPMELIVHGYKLTIRVEDAKQIAVDLQKQNEANTVLNNRNAISIHPGLGEGGKFHPKGSENPLPAGTTFTFALIGNQNSGKTTLFN